ncbi:MAG: hypothetical protein CVT88_01080 [Candidatus Altiarchaeales archaeon HGW-Altiarchaeales-1]|nr:MAG: hypothetical protein CVT88_01080 [Candidatus Altiarchaeales archaeon HGW-Altiarchaeales-1]
MQDHNYTKQNKDVFVSCSFDLEDKKVVDLFINSLKSSFNVIKAECPEAKELKEKIIPKISNSPVFCVILTKKYKATDRKGNNINISSPWIYSEIGAAISLSKENMIIFVEEGIKDFGMLSQSYNYVSFNRQKIESNDKKYTKKLLKDIKNYANSIYKNSDLEEREQYKVTTGAGHITIYKDGHGIEDFNITINVLSDSFNRKKIGFSLDACAFKDITLKNFPLEISKDADKKRFSGKTFYARVLSPNNISIDRYEIIKEETKDDSIGLYLYFKTNTGTIPKGTKIRYAWEWSCDGMYPFKKEQLKNASLKKRLDCAECTFELLTDYDNFDVVVNFEIGYQLEKCPFIEIYDGATDEKVDTIESPEKEEDLNYTRYKFRLGHIKANRKCVVKWIPQ